MTVNLIYDTFMEKGGQVTMSLHDRIKEARNAKGLTQTELGELIGVAKTTVSGYEKNREPTAAQLGMIADVLDVDVTFLLQDEVKRHRDTRATPDEMENIIRKYRTLDEYGKGTVDLILDRECKRIKAEKERRRLGPTETSDTRFIPLYYTPAAAGYTEPAVGQDFDYIEVGPEVPRRADCAIKISGKSMEPYVKDESIVYVTREPIENGDVGIFCVDGDMLCKQYFREESGRVRLLSLNRDYADADRIIRAKDDDTVMTYYGKVLLDFRPRIVL